MKVLQRDSHNEIYFNSACGDECSVTFGLSKFLENISENEWFILGIPLKCLQDNNVDLSTISKPLGFNTKGSWTLELGRVYLEGGMGGKSIFPCSLLDGEHE